MQYYTYTSEFDKLGGNVSRTLGQMIVVMFMFYSGYGIGESVKRKGMGYIKSFPKNRVLKTLLHFDVAILIYFILSLILELNYPSGQVALAFIGWTSIGNSNWYIFAVIILYVITWIAFSIFRKNKVAAAAGVTLLTVVNEVCKSDSKLCFFVSRVFIEAKCFEVFVSLVEDRAAGGFIYAAAFHTYEAVFYDIALC